MSDFTRISEEQIRQFVVAWYLALDQHVPPEECARLVADEGLEMIFPEQTLHGIEDFKAWYDLMKRINRMFNLEMDLSGLKRQSEELVAAWDAKINHLAQAMPQLRVKDYMDKVNADFATQDSADRLSDVWEDALRDIFGEDESL